MGWLGWLGIALASGLLAVVLLVCFVIFTSKDSAALGRELDTLLANAKKFGLPERDIANAAEMLEHAEFGLAFDIVVVQLEEFAIPISAEYYEQIQALATKLKLPEQSYVFVKKLIT